MLKLTVQYGKLKVVLAVEVIAVIGLLIMLL